MNVSAFASGDTGRRIALRAYLGMVAPDAVTGEAHLFTYDEWLGHPTGPFQFTPEIAQTIVANFNAQANPVPFTYEHDQEPGQPRPAAGWVQSLDIREDGLYATVEWTDRAASMIRAGEYRFCSVVVDFESIHRKTGENVGAELLEVGLTNTPFVDGQRRLECSRRADGPTVRRNSMDPKEIAAKLSEIKAALGLDDKATVEQLKAALDAYAELDAALAGKPEPEDMGAPETMDAAKLSRLKSVAPFLRKLSIALDGEGNTEEGDTEANTVAAAVGDGTDSPAADVAAVNMVMTKLTEATGLDAAGLITALESNIEAVASVLTGANASGLPSDSDAVSASVGEMGAAVAQLSKKVEDLQGELIATEVKHAVELRRLPKGQSDHIVELGRTNLALARKLISGAAESGASTPVPTGRLLNRTGPQAGTPSGAEEDADAGATSPEELTFVRSLKRWSLANKKVALADFRAKQAAALAGN